MHRVNIVDDDSELLEGLQRRIAIENPGWEVHCTTSPKQALSWAESDAVWVIDWLMPEMDGLTLCQALRAYQAGIPDSSHYVLIITGNNDVEHTVAALEGGADDWLAKPFDLRELIARLRVGQRVLDLEAGLRQVNAELKKHALTDDLTGLANRRHATSQLELELERTFRQTQSLGIVLLDVDFFKKVNDQRGHGSGDRVLKEVALRISQHVRGYDLVSRWGGEEFLVICPHANAPIIVQVAERLRRAVAGRPIDLGDGRVELTISAGACYVPLGAKVESRLVLQAADSALYRAKQAGRNCVRSVTNAFKASTERPARRDEQEDNGEERG